MPQAPTAQTLGTVNAQPNTSVISPGVSPVGAATAQLGETINQVGGQVQTAVDSYQVAQAKSKFLQTQIQTQNELAHDQDFNTHAQRYTEAVGSTLKDVTDQISNPTARRQFMAEIGPEYQRGLSEVKNNAFKLGAEYGNAQTTQDAFNNIQAAGQTSDPAKKAKLFQATNQMYQARVAQGFMNPEDATKQRIALTEKYGKDAINSLPYEQQVKTLSPVVVGDNELHKYGVTDNTKPNPTDLAKLTDLVKQQESGGQQFGPDGQLLTSPAGAKGEMQVMDVTNTQPGFGVKPAQNDSPEERSRVGKDYLAAMVDKYGVAKGLAAYNAGPGKLDTALKDATAAGQPDQWLTHLPTETQDYVHGILSKYGETQPGATYRQATGTLADYFPADELKQKLHDSAVAAISQKMETDPAGAIALTKDPDYVKAINPIEMKRIHQAIIDNFDGQRSEHEALTVINQASQNQSAWNDFNTGKMNLQSFSQLQSQGALPKELSDFMLKALTKKPDKQTPEASAAKYAQLFEKYNSFAIKNQNGQGTGNGDLRSYVDFQKDVMGALNDGYIDKSQANGFISKMAPALNKQVSNPKDKGQTWGQWLGITENSPYVKGYNAINEWSKTNGTHDAAADTSAKAEILRRFVLASEDADYDSGKMKPGDVARSAIESYHKNKFPVLQLMDTMPHNIILGAGQKESVTPVGTAKPDATVPEVGKLQRNQKTGAVRRVLPDGKTEDIPPDEVKKLEARGYISNG